LDLSGRDGVARRRRVGDPSGRGGQQSTGGRRWAWSVGLSVGGYAGGRPFILTRGMGRRGAAVADGDGQSVTREVRGERLEVLLWRPSSAAGRGRSLPPRRRVALVGSARAGLGGDFGGLVVAMGGRRAREQPKLLRLRRPVLDHGYDGHLHVHGQYARYVHRSRWPQRDHRCRRRGRRWRLSWGDHGRTGRRV